MSTLERLQELRGSQWEYLRVLAAHAVEKHTTDYELRKVFRFYSKKFHTPLHQVSELPLEDVIIAFFEESLESMEPEDLAKEIELLVETAGERTERLRKEAKFKTLNEEALQLSREANEKAEEIATKKRIEDLLVNPKPPISVLPETPKLSDQKTVKKEEPFAPGVAISFIDDAEFQAAVNAEPP